MEKKILVADDSLTIQKVVELTFAGSDYRLTCVANGRLALEKIRQEAPDVVLADVVMPEKNGYEVCEEIKRNPSTASIPVILLAGTFEPFDRDRAKRLGCDAIVSKPFDSRELRRKVESLIAGRSGDEAPAEVRERAGAPDRSTDPLAKKTAEPAAPSPFPIAPPPPDPFGTGFVEEDFTGSIRSLRAGRAEPLAHLYGPDDVESALAEFREVEPTSRVTDWGAEKRAALEVPPARPTVEAGARHLDEGAEEDFDEPERPSFVTMPAVPEPAIPSFAAEPPVRVERDTPPVRVERDTPPVVAASDDGRTQRIDVSDFRMPRPAGVGVPSAAAGSSSETEPVEPLPPLPLEMPVRRETPRVDAAAAGAAPARDLTDAELDRLAEKVAARVVAKLSDRIVREVAWEVVPETAELVVRERLRELESGVE